MSWLLCLLAWVDPAAPAPLHQWRLNAEHVTQAAVAPRAGKLQGRIIGPVRFADQLPHALLFDGRFRQGP